MMNQQTIIQRDTNLVFNELDGEIVMMNLERGEYYGLNPIGSRIWELIEEPISVEKLIEHLTNEFDVDKEQCFQDIRDFIVDLIGKKIVKEINLSEQRAK